MWLLSSDGSLEADADLGAIREIYADSAIVEVPRGRSLVIVFGATADGRGFSVARQLRARGFQGTLVAAGPLIPDQARHAFQSGFDAIAITPERFERHGARAWQDAVEGAARALYFADTTSRAEEPGIWALRHAQ